MKKRKNATNFFGGSRYYWTEIIIFCALLTVAVFIYDRSSPSVQPQNKLSVKQAKKTEQRAPAAARPKPEPHKAQQNEAKGNVPAQRTEQKQETVKQASPPEKKAAASDNKTPKPQNSADQQSTSQAIAPLQASGEEYTVVHVDDGDSLELADSHNRKIRVRLYGIDAPEGKQSYGNESRANMQRMVKGKKVQIRRMYTDNYQRAVAIVFLSSGGKADALSLNERQVQDGMAWVYDFFCTSGECNTWKFEEAMAKNQKIGLWKNPSPVPPWQWRAITNQ